MVKTAAFTFETVMTPGAVQFRGSDLQRRYRTVLDEARKSPVSLTDRDGHRLGIGDWDEMAFAWTFMRILDAIAQFHAAWACHRKEPPSEWAQMTPFPFLAAFDAEEVEEFAGELIPYLEESVRRRDLEGFAGNLRAWESSAETYGDERMLRQMNMRLDPTKFVEVAPPAK